MRARAGTPNALFAPIFPNIVFERVVEMVVVDDEERRRRAWACIV